MDLKDAYLKLIGWLLYSPLFLFLAAVVVFVGFIWLFYFFCRLTGVEKENRHTKDLDET